MGTLTRCIKEPYCGLSHLTGSVLSVGGLITLLLLANNGWHYISFSIYGLSLIVLYTASGLLHSIRCSPEVEDRLERFDYAAIFCLIAGTYTPLCLTILRGPWGWTMLAIEWTLALIGIIAVVVTKARPRKLTMTLYVVMGWLVLTAMGPVLQLMPAGAIAWLIVGGAIYSLGAVVFAFNRPHLWPGKFNAHDLWHTMVLAGSACHFVVMLWLIS